MEMPLLSPKPTVVTVPNEKLALAVKVLARKKRNGQLRINFSQGTATGGVQWIENIPKGKAILAVD